MRVVKVDVERQIKYVLDKFKESNFHNNEARRCIAECIAARLKEYVVEKENNKT